MKFHQQGVFSVDDIVIQVRTINSLNFVNFETPVYTAPSVDNWSYDPSLSRVYFSNNTVFMALTSGKALWKNSFTTSGTNTYTATGTIELQGNSSSKNAKLWLHQLDASNTIIASTLVATITTNGTFSYLLPTATNTKYQIGWTIGSGATIKLTAYQLKQNSSGLHTGNFTNPTIVKPSYDGWTIDTESQTLVRKSIGGSWRMVPNIKKTFSVTAGTTYRFSADIAYLYSGGVVILPFSTQANLLAGSAAIYDSIKVYKMVSGVPVYMTAVRYGYDVNTVPVSIDFTAPSGVSQILIEFVPGNYMATNYGYYADNLRFSSLGNFSTFYTSNFTAGTIVSQNTDGWGTNWATSYMNVLTGSPNKLRISGETPSIQRNFTVVPNNIYKFVYTQSENNSVSFIVEQSPNGTSSWSTLMNTTSTNGTCLPYRQAHTQSFTPTQGYVRVKYSASAAFSLANASLTSVDVDTVYTVLARGGYRYGFQNQEKDDEIKGEGNSVNYKYRMHDPRLGRFFAIDPLTSKYPYWSPYQFSGNRVIDAVELEGLEFGIVIGAQARGTLIASVSTSIDVIFYFEGAGDDPWAFKIITAETAGIGGGLLAGLTDDLHAGIWIGNDESIAGNSTLIGFEAALEGGFSFEIGIPEPTGGYDQNLPGGVMLTLGLNAGAALNAYGEYAYTTTQTWLVIDKNGISSPSGEEFIKNLKQYLTPIIPFTGPSMALDNSLSMFCSCGMRQSDGRTGFGLDEVAPILNAVSSNWSTIRTEITKMTGMSLPAQLSSFLTPYLEDGNSNGNSTSNTPAPYAEGGQQAEYTFD